MAQKNFDANQLSVVFGVSPVVGFATDELMSNVVYGMIRQRSYLIVPVLILRL